MATIVSQNSWARAVLDYSYSRTSRGVYLRYSLRLEALSGYMIYDTISYNIVANGSSIKSDSGINVTEKKSVRFFSDATYTVRTGVFDGGQFGLSFSISGNASLNLSGVATVNYFEYATGVGTPSVSITDNRNNTFSISATAGSSGTNNAATGVGGISYSFDNSNWISGSSGSITGNTTVYARAYTIGTYNNSDYAVVSLLVTAITITKCGKPDLSLSSSMLHFNDNNLTLSISASSGVNNDITGYEVQYSGSDTLTFTNWSNSSSINTSLSDYDFDFVADTSYFNTLKSLNKKYICFRVKTIGSVSGYDSDYSYISIMTDKGYPRVKNSDGIYETCIPYVLKEGTWTQCVLNSGVLSKLKDSQGEYILDSNGENIYTLEDSSVILNS